MANIDQTEAKRLLDSSLGTSNATTAPAAPLKAALDTTVGTSSAAGTEVTGGSYARQGVTVGAAANGSGGTAGLAVASNTNVVSYTGMPDTTANPVKGIEIYENGGRRVWYGALQANKTTGAGDTLSFAAGAIALQNG